MNSVDSIRSVIQRFISSVTNLLYRIYLGSFTLTAAVMGSKHGSATHGSDDKWTGADGITCEQVDLPRKSDKGKVAFVLHNVYTPEECKEFIDKTEKIGYIPAVVNTGPDTFVYAPDYRKGHRVLVDSKEYSEEMMKRIKTFLPDPFQGHKLVEINERFRFLRYDPGDFFKPHSDGCYIRPETGDETLLTIQLYLNEGFKGGCTTFLGGYKAGQAKDAAVVPKTGSILVFQHDIYHEGSLVTEGMKYTVRTDILYTGD